MALRTEIEDTFAEAFKMYASRFIITALNEEWAMNAARCVTGFATSVIGCGCEAGIEGLTEDTFDGRIGVSVLLFSMSEEMVEKHMVERIGQCVLTCPTTSCFNGMENGRRIKVGRKLRFFGDGFQVSKVIGKRRFWRIPVMEGEFIIEEEYGVAEAVGGGNLLILGNSVDSVLSAGKAAVDAARGVKGVILPFPGGIVRSGSKVGSKYKFLKASTNTAFVPQLRAHTSSGLPEGVRSVMEIVFDGLTIEVVKRAMKKAISAVLKSPGIVRISAGNYGGNLGKYKIYLKELLGDGTDG